MMTGGLLLMAVMMGLMFFGGHHMGRKHRHGESPAGAAVSGTTAISTAAAQVPVQPPEGGSGPGHSH